MPRGPSDRSPPRRAARMLGALLLAALPVRDALSQAAADGAQRVAASSATPAIVLGFAVAIVLCGVVGGLYVVRVRTWARRLVEAMKVVGQGDFETRAGGDSPRVVGEVGAAFDAMVEHLARDLSSMRAGAEIDREVLVNADLDRIAATVIAHAGHAVRGDAFALAVLAEDDGRPSGRVFSALAGQRGTPSIASAELSIAEIVEMKATGAPVVVDLAQRSPSIGARLAEAGCRALAMVPIDWNGKRIALLLAGARRREALDADATGRLSALGARAADALAGAAREELVYANAHFDALTGLPNRLLLKDRITREVSRAQRDRRELAVLVCDLDRFREVGRVLGDAAAEKALQQVAARLRACLRDSDTAARTHGDEFAVLLSDLASPHDAGIVADAIVRAVAQPLQIEGREVFVTASVGVAVYPFDGTDGDDLVRHATMAMARAKSQGRNRHVYFEDRMNRESADRSRAAAELRLAVERGELILHFQPQVDLAKGEVVAAEALVRWRHPERGVILPREFIPVAEQTGLITRIGYWVVDEVGRTIDGWRAKGVEAPRVMVNVSLRQFRDPAFPDAVRFAMQRWSVGRGGMGFEIAESALLDDPETVVRALSALKSLGALVSIEDFGLRRSSLSLMTRLPYDLLKIDRTFVRDIARDTESASLVRAIVAMAHQFGKQVIAEGVEADTQREFLRHHSCDLAQGILLGRPLPANEFMSYLVSQRLLRTSAERAKKLVER